jgi:hypothetical protein
MVYWSKQLRLTVKPVYNYHFWNPKFNEFLPCCIIFQRKRKEQEICSLRKEKQDQAFCKLLMNNLVLSIMTAKYQELATQGTSHS